MFVVNEEGGQGAGGYPLVGARSDDRERNADDLYRVAVKMTLLAAFGVSLVCLAQSARGQNQQPASAPAPSGVGNILSLFASGIVTRVDQRMINVDAHPRVGQLWTRAAGSAASWSDVAEG